MTFDFTDTLPEHVSSPPTVISGVESLSLNHRIYLIVKTVKDENAFYEIRYKAHCSPFKEAMIVDDLLAVGHEEHFYLFNMVTKTNIVRLEMGGYFGHLYYNDDFFYIADADGLYCIDKNAAIRWRNNSLGIDGVFIDEFTENQITGSGECDPPGGWKDFILDKATGLVQNM